MKHTTVEEEIRGQNLDLDMEFPARVANRKAAAVRRCQVCGEPEGKRKLHRDHCHITNKQRGLLCHGCNLALGFTQDDPETLRALADYLETYSKSEHTV